MLRSRADSLGRAPTTTEVVLQALLAWARTNRALRSITSALLEYKITLLLGQKTHSQVRLLQLARSPSPKLRPALWLILLLGFTTEFE